MKKVLILILSLLFITSCSIEAEENTGLNIAQYITSIGTVDETTDKQKFIYEFVISNDKHKAMKEESVEVVFNEWIKKRLIEHNITQQSIFMDAMVIIGYIIFDTKDLTKDDIEKNESFVKGIKIKSTSDEEFFIES